MLGVRERMEDCQCLYSLVIVPWPQCGLTPQTPLSPLQLPSVRHQLNCGVDEMSAQSVPIYWHRQYAAFSWGQPCSIRTWLTCFSGTTRARVGLIFDPGILAPTSPHCARSAHTLK